jgi:hypothetical protein
MVRAKLRMLPIQSLMAAAGGSGVRASGSVAGVGTAIGVSVGSGIASVLVVLDAQIVISSTHPSNNQYTLQLWRSCAELTQKSCNLSSGLCYKPG